MSKSRFYMESLGSCLMGSLIESLPDERPITSLVVVEDSSKCPFGYWPVLKTYDEDSDADLLRHQPMFGKKISRYLCISKSEGMPERIVSGIKIVNTNDPPPPGYTSMKLTLDTEQRAWRKKQLCYLLTVPPPAGAPPLTDIILCSKLKKAPNGFQYAGEMNGIVLCYKVAGSSNGPSPVHASSPLSRGISARKSLEISKNDNSIYENININGHNTPDASKRLIRVPPERPPKTSEIVAELNKLNLQEMRSPSPNKQFSDESPHDYETLSPLYNLKPSRPAPQVPGAPVVPKKGITPGKKPPPRSAYNTLGGWNELDGIPFYLNPTLEGSFKFQIPLIKKKTMSILDHEYKYDFSMEKQNL